MDGSCSKYGGEERCTRGFGGGNMRERDHLEEPVVDGRIILSGSSASGLWGACNGFMWLMIGTGVRLL